MSVVTLASVLAVTGVLLLQEPSGHTQSQTRTFTGGTLTVYPFTNQTTGLPSGFSIGGAGPITLAKSGLTAGGWIAYIEANVNNGNGPSSEWGFEAGTGSSMPLGGSNEVIWTSANGYLHGGATTPIQVGESFGELGNVALYDPICAEGYEGWVCFP